MTLDAPPRLAGCLRRGAPRILVAALVALLVPAPGRAQEAEWRATLELGDVAAAAPVDTDEPARLRVPLRVRPPETTGSRRRTNFASVSIHYDPSVLRYEGVAVDTAARESFGWKLSSVTGFREVDEGQLRGVFLRAPQDARRGGLEQTLLARITFVVEPPGPDVDDEELVQRTLVSFRPLELDDRDASSDSFLGWLPEDAPEEQAEWRDTRLEGAQVDLYRRSFLRAGGGEMTRREQSFVLPLYLTWFGPADVLRVGVDYDELILRDVVPRPAHLLDDGRVEIEALGRGSSAFVLRLRPRPPERPILGAHVADLVMHYDLGPEPIEGVLRVVPRLLDVDEARGGAATSTRSVAGLIHLLEPRFVRGNVDSSARRRGALDAVSAGPDVQDAVTVLESLFLEGGPSIPCREAADTDDNGTVRWDDAVLLLRYLFHGGPPPAAPFPDAGTDRADSPAHLGCDVPVPYFRPAGS